MTRFHLLCCFLIGTCWLGAARTESLPQECGSLKNGYGPFDYRSPGEPDAIRLVETFHFTPDVQALRKGQSGTLPQDLAYTLNAFPNHPWALNSVARYALTGMERSVRGGPLQFSPDCWFRRGIAFRPDDPAVRAIYANFLFKSRRYDEAKAQYEAALKIEPESAEVNYNYGLLLFELGDLTEAAEKAKVAYDNHYPLPGLRNKLKERGVDSFKVVR